MTEREKELLIFLYAARYMKTSYEGPQCYSINAMNCFSRLHVKFEEMEALCEKGYVNKVDKSDGSRVYFITQKGEKEI